MPQLVIIMATVSDKCDMLLKYMLGYRCYLEPSLTIKQVNILQ